MAHTSDLQQFADSLLSPGATPVPDVAARVAEEYPYFILPGIMMLSHGGQEIDPDTRRAMLERLALAVPDRDMLRRLVTADGDRFASFYPDEADRAPISTDKAIETFIANYGEADPREEALLERLIFNPTPDYAQLLAREEERSVPEPVDLADAGSQDALINAFILKSREEQSAPPTANVETSLGDVTTEDDNTTVQSPKTSDDTLLSESLAKIYIKQRRYTKAFEIIHNLSLNYPEKSIYFADQLRFLQKLIINQQHNK
ncbi:MAG: hypothetical protein NC117_06175 [Pseudoflavonifractor sp.]|nr:hypothetical protein [Pseudoflavonifractor sp.]